MVASGVSRVSHLELLGLGASVGVVPLSVVEALFEGAQGLIQRRSEAVHCFGARCSFN